ncbi:ABC transporter permease [Salinicoccus albus]|uniref:ABC transporter permease n=1 Tax=Salinicoccus albus TaxID=418756 RepID=UPI000364AEB1|nr:ABC transporter permease [Salinicoccus albus]
MNAGRIMTIFEKDFKEFTRNMMLFTSILLPVLIAFMYGSMGDSQQIPSMLIFLIVGIAFSSILTSGIMTMMAEENEKNTLRGLVQSPASMMDILVGKSLVVTLMTAVSLAVSFLIMDMDMSWGAMDITGIILLGLFFLNSGIGVGLTVKSVATTSVYLLPIMLIFGFTPMIEIIIQDETHIIRQAADYLPLYQNMAIYDGEALVPMLILSLWVVLSFVYAAWSFKARMKDA